MKFHNVVRCVAACVPALLVGCATPYVPSAGETMVPVKVLGMGEPLMCKAGQVYGLSPDKSGVALVPVGDRISVGSYMYFDGYMVSHSCRVWVSFIPKAGGSYVTNSGLGGTQRCFAELVVEDSTKETGVAFEPTAGRGACVPAK